MSTKKAFKRYVPVFCLALVCSAVGPRAFGDVVLGEVLAVRQPDGSQVQVRIWGDEFYGVTESLDGYTVVRDPVSHFLCYAGLTPDGNALYSTGVAVGSVAPDALGLTPHLRINQAAAKAKARAARARWDEQRRLILGGRSGPRGPTTGNVQGICLIVDFVDDVWVIPSATVNNYCNQVGFNGFGDNGSVRDYFYDVSDGALTYTNFVPAAYYRAAHPKGYYTDPGIPYGQRAQELIIEALTNLDNQGFDFSQYDAAADGTIDALNCFYAGDIWNNWAEGLWPHSWWVWFCADGVCTDSYQITNMGANLYLRTFCHENGHMLMGWPDLYDYDYDSTGVGRYCLMAYSTTNMNPCEPCAYMKYIAGWSQPIVLTVPQPWLTVPAARINRCYKFNHPTLANEYYLIENRQQTWRDAELPDAGLAIWHIDTLGDNSNNEMTPESHFLVTLVQADGRWDLEHDVNYGDDTDLWAAPDYTQCTPATVPNTDWWSGDPSGLAITNISASGNPMTFDYSAPSYVGRIVAWGNNENGQCNVPAPNTGFVADAAGWLHSLGLKADGSIVAWGDNWSGLCDVPAPNDDFVAVAAGYLHSLGLKAGGSIVAWGWNDYGQCNVPAPNSDFVAVAGGGYHSLGLKADGSVVAWGWNSEGQCDVPAPNSGFVAVAAGERHSLGLKADGSIVAWGWPDDVPAPNTGFVAVAGGGYHSLSLKAVGSVVAWGANWYGQCDVPAPNSRFVAVAAGHEHSLGLKAGGSIVAWGYNADGQCNVPVPNADFVAVAGGFSHSLGLKGYLRGDMNCDGVVNFADINPFVLALGGQAGYEAAYPTCNRYNADCNGDGTVNFADINPFVALLSSP